MKSQRRAVSLCTALLLAQLAALHAADNSKPNIVFLFSDDQTARAVGCYGNKEVITPHLDQLAQEGVRFTNHYNTTSICMASRCSVMTGLYEYRHGCNFNHGDLEQRFIDQSYPVLLRRAGYYSCTLLPALRGEDYPRPLRGPLIHHSASGYFAIRDGHWKLNLFRGSGGSLAPRLIQPKGNEPPFELYEMKQDWRETANVHDQHPDVVERLKATANKIVLDGLSTPGMAQKNDGPPWWPQLTWIPAAAGSTRLPAPGKTTSNDQ